MLHHRAQRHQPDAGQQHDADTPQHAAFLGRFSAARLPGREQVDHLAQEGKQPGFVDRYTGAQQCQRQYIATRAARAGPQKAQQAHRWWRGLVGWEGV
ncbi:hypothetical protein D3C79_908980 [compost metagenome]